MSRPFRHVDHDQTIVFGAGALESSLNLLGEEYVLLTTPRAAAAAPAVAGRAVAELHVPPGQIPEVAAGLLDDVRTAASERPIVALGGGRVIDVAKAVAAALSLPGPVAIPTSLSGAEMTGVHRHAKGVDESVPRVRATVVINDPALSASQPEADLAASSANALGHAVTAALSTRSTPIAASVAVDAIRHLANGWRVAGTSASGQPKSSVDINREAIALGALLAGWAVDRSGLGPHHALAQTAVRTADLSHAQTNAALLPHTVGAFRQRLPVRFAELDAAAGGSLDALTDLLFARAGNPGLGPLATDSGLFDQAVTAAAARPELRRIPPPFTPDEIREIYRAAAQ